MPGTPANPTGIYELDWDQSANAPIFPIRDWRLQRDPAYPDRVRIISWPADPVRCGNYAARFELQRADRFQDSARSELTSSPTAPPPVELWYGFSIYLHEWAVDLAPEIVTQWHHNSNAGSPPLAIMTKNGRWAISERDFSSTGNQTIDTSIGMYDTNRWTDWVVHIKWSGGVLGELSIWKDGLPVQGFYKKTGQNSFPDLGNYLKIGIYKWDWARANPTSTTLVRLLYHDEVRIADGQSGSYALVAPPVRLYRYWSGAGSDHFYSSNWSDLQSGNSGWNYEWVQCRILPAYQSPDNNPPHPGAVPLYRYWNPQISDHFYTTDWNELGVGRFGWSLEKIEGYVFSTQLPGTVPLYRYWSASSSDHFYTTDWNELGEGNNSWTFERIQCYVFPAK